MFRQVSCLFHMCLPSTTLDEFDKCTHILTFLLKKTTDIAGYSHGLLSEASIASGLESVELRTI